MAVAVKGGSGPSSPQNLVAPLPVSGIQSHDPEIHSYDEQKLKKPKKKKPQPAVDAMSMLMVESRDPEIRPCDEQKPKGKLSAIRSLDPEISSDNEQKPKEKYVRDDRQTFAPIQFSPYWQSAVSLLRHQQPHLVTCDFNEILEKDHEIVNQQKKLSQKDQIIRDLEDKLKEKEGEVCAKDSSLREKEAELATCRKNLDHCETEKRELQEAHRASQGSIINENEQLKMELARCAAWNHQQLIANQSLQAWNHQQSITIQSLQAQLEVRTVDFNQLLSDHQRQFAEVERLNHHAHERQQELQGARQRIKALTDELRILQNKSADVTQLGQNNGNQQDVNGGGSVNTNSGVLPNGNTDNATSFVSSGNASTQAALEVSQISAPSQTDQNLTRSDANYKHYTSVDGQVLHSGNLDVDISPGTEPDSVISPSDGKEQLLSQDNGTNTILVCWGSTGLTSEIRLDTLEQNSDAEEQDNVNLTDHGLQGEVAEVAETSFATDASVSI